MSKAGGITYLIKHGRAAMPTVTRTEMPRAKGVKRMEIGGLTSTTPPTASPTPANAPLNYGTVPDYVFVPGGMEIDERTGKPVWKSGRYEVRKAANTPAAAGATGSVGVPTGGGGSGGGGRDYVDQQTDYGAVIGDETASGKSWNELSKEQQGAYLDAVPGGRLAEKLVNGFLENTFVGKGLTALAGGLDSLFGRNNVDYQSGSANAARNWSSTLGYTPGQIAAMQDEDQRWSGGTPEGYDPAGDTRPTGYGPDGMGPPSSAAPSAADTQASIDSSVSESQANDARSAGGNYGWAKGGRIPHMAAGGIGSLAAHGGYVGSYAAGGRMLRGPGDGLSDHIPAVIGKGKPARLADGEFVVSADVVSSLGGGSTEAGARKLYAMMDRIRQNAHGTKKQVKKVNDKKVLPA